MRKNDVVSYPSCNHHVFKVWYWYTITSTTEHIYSFHGFMDAYIVFWHHMLCFSQMNLLQLLNDVDFPSNFGPQYWSPIFHWLIKTIRYQFQLAKKVRNKFVPLVFEWFCNKNQAGKYLWFLLSLTHERTSNPRFFWVTRGWKIVVWKRGYVVMISDSENLPF